MSLEQANKEAEAILAKATTDAATQRARRERRSRVWERLRTAVVALAASYLVPRFAAPFFGVHPLLVGLPAGLLAAVLLPPLRRRERG